MEKGPKPQGHKEESQEKLTRRKFLKIVGGGLAGLGVSPSEKTSEEQKWLREISVVPDSHRQVVVEAYRSLPPRLQAVLRTKEVRVTFRDGEILGAAAASDQFGLDIETHSAYVRWPAGAESVSFPWGKLRLVDATRHELSHIALERIFSKSSKMWVDLIEALRDEGTEFLKKVTAGHADAANLYSNSSMAHYQALHEYLASLAEHCGKPVRVPLPSGRARPIVEALVSGGTCTD